MRRQEQDRFRRLVIEKLREKNYPRKILAPLLEVSPSAITRKMNGETPFNDEEVHKISQFLQLHMFSASQPRATDVPLASETYDPGVKVFNDAIPLLSLSDKSDMYFILAVYLEAKLPRTNFGPMLRALADQS